MEIDCTPAPWHPHIVANNTSVHQATHGGTPAYTLVSAVQSALNVDRDFRDKTICSNIEGRTAMAGMVDGQVRSLLELQSQIQHTKLNDELPPCRCLHSYVSHTHHAIYRLTTTHELALVSKFHNIWVFLEGGSKFPL
jgi:hypothetical protein